MNIKIYELLKDDLATLGFQFVNTLLQDSTPESVENYLVKDLGIERGKAKEIILNEINF